MCLTQFLDSSSKCTEELAFINHPTYLKNKWWDHHEQISCDNSKYLLRPTNRLLGFVRNEKRARKSPDNGIQ